MRLVTKLLVTFQKFLPNILLIVGSLLFCLIIGELTSRIFFPDMQIKYMNDRELLARFEPNQEGILPFAGGSRSQKIRINELGLRGTSLAKMSSRRILFLGDSFTFGSGVEEDKTFPALVNYALGEEISVVNGGQPGYGIYQMHGLLRRLITIVRPELVVVVIWEGLFVRQPLSEGERENFLKQSAKLKTLKSVSVFGTHLYRMYERLLVRYGLDNLTVSLLKEKKQAGIPIQEQYLHAVKADEERLLEIKDLSGSYESRLIIVFWPRAGFVRTFDSSLSSTLTSELKEFSEKNQIVFYSVEDTLAVQHSEELLIPNDWHPTPFAHCVVAQYLVNSLEKLGYHAENPLYCTSKISTRLL